MLIEKQIQSFFCDNGYFLALAESCTGGSISKSIVTIPGSSKFFLGSIVAYSNVAKKSLLSVSEETLKNEGAVSHQAAQAMAEGALLKFGADFSLSTTGYAGPESDEEGKPVGLVFFAVASKKYSTTVWSRIFSGNRREVMKKSTDHALQELFKFVSSL